MKRFNSRNGRFMPPTVFRSLTNCLLLACVVAVLVDGLSNPSFAEDPSTKIRQYLADEDSDTVDDEDVKEEPDRFRRVAHRQAAPESTNFRTAQTSDGAGVIGQAGHLAFKTFGRTQSISPLEAMPYILTDEHFVFGDFRGFVSNGGLFGGNFGLGYRYLREDLNAWFGASAWYDADSTTGRNYNQFGLSFETLFNRWELRSNVYLPFSSTQTYSTSIGNEHIVGNQLLYSLYTDQGTALRGVDLEVGYNLPVPDQHRLRGFVGYYHFEGGAAGGINGFKTRVEGVINNTVSAQVMYTNDPLFGSNVMVGATIQFPWGGSHPTSTWRQNTPSPFRFVERNYNVIVDRNQMVQDNLIAMSPTTHAAYKVSIVDTTSSISAPNANGSAANPYHTISAAQVAGSDLILVAGNSVITSGVTLAQGQHLIGDGSQQKLALDGGGFLTVPNVISGGATPVFSGISGPAVTMASGSEVSGFKFNNITGNAIAGTGINGATIRDVTFDNIVGDAIRLSNGSGSFVLDNVVVNSASGNGISFVGGAPDISLKADISNTTLDGILLSNLTGGSIDIHNTTIDSTGGAGLRFNNVTADAVIDSLTTSHTSGAAISLTGGTSANTYHFANTTTINQPNSTGFNANNSNAAVIVDNLVLNSTAGSPAVSLTNSTGSLKFSNLNVTTSNAIGLYGRGLTSLIVNGGSITTQNAGAIDIQNSTVNMALTQVSTDTGPFGIRLINNIGSFAVNGNNAYASGGTIKNTTNAIIVTDNGNVSFKYMDLTTNGVAVQSAGNDQVALGLLRVTGSTGYAVDSLNDLVLMVTNSTFTNNGTIGGGTIRAQVDTVATYQWLVQGNVITDHNGTPVLMQALAGGNGASLATTVSQNGITADRSGMSLINVNWNGPLSASVASNILAAGGPNMTAITLKDSSLTDSVVARINNNSATFTNSNGTGILASAAAGSTFQVDTNIVDFKGIGGTGMRFNLGGLSSTWIYSNSITDEAGGATGMLFDAVAANSRLQIEANTINLLSTDLTVHRGIIFTAVSPTIQLNSSTTNVINNASTTFSIPANSATGYLLINGTQVH